ncbi:hypothetical protein J27TS7_44040 [Paenibacillus dendritiformis]|nr:hypothetical protein J27TS7_44040 [Paenibacillus dendritiformis]
MTQGDPVKPGETRELRETQRNLVKARETQRNSGKKGKPSGIQYNLGILRG